MNRKYFSVLLVVQFLMVSGAFATQPDRTKTPGVLCTEDDPDFSEYRYPEHIPYCERNVDQSKKQKVADEYGIPKSDWSKYEFDHLIPLGIGGSSDIRNIWPQPKVEALEKDKVEQQVFNGMQSGKMTQAEAVKMIWDWIDEHYKDER